MAGHDLALTHLSNFIFPSFPLFCFLSSHVDSLSALMYPTVPYLSIFPLFSLPRILPSTLYLTYLFSFLELTLIVIFSLGSFSRCCSVAQSCLSLCDPIDFSVPGFPVLQYLQEFAQTHAHWVNDAIQPSHPLLFLSSIFPSVRSLPMSLLRRPKYWSFNISPSNEYSGLISIRIDWFELLTVQGTLKSLLQHRNLKASILEKS